MLEMRLGDNGEIVVSGRFDASQVSKAESFLDAVADPRVMDLGGLEYISSAGLGVLLKAQKRLMKTGKGLVLLNVNTHIYDILHYSGFDQLFEVRRVAGA